jgi:Rrf2 family transcriptional regulator, iron-sulfur cluster assembly transcription factor
MLVSKKGYYFIKVILFLAFSKKGSFSIKELAERLAISEKILEQALLGLKNRGILSSKRGPQGGYWLSADVKDMTLMDILGTTGKKLEIFPGDRDRKTRFLDEVLEAVESDVEKDVLKTFENVRIKDLVAIIKERVTETELNYKI